jgi:hypothetical protein
MANPSIGSQRYAVHCATAILDVMRRIHEQQSRHGRGQGVTRAFRQILRRLERDPVGFGEPAYRLPTMGLQVRKGIVRPLVVFYAISDHRPLVLIKDVKFFAETSQQRTISLVGKPQRWLICC